MKKIIIISLVLSLLLVSNSFAGTIKNLKLIPLEGKNGGSQTVKVTWDYEYYPSEYNNPGEVDFTIDFWDQNIFPGVDDIIQIFNEADGEFYPACNFTKTLEFPGSDAPHSQHMEEAFWLNISEEIGDDVGDKGACQLYCVLKGGGDEFVLPSIIKISKDTKLPKVTITKSPSKLVTQVEVEFEFYADEVFSDFYCKLNGFDQDWVFINGKDDIANNKVYGKKKYTNLPPGTYTFLVYARAPEPPSTNGKVTKSKPFYVEAPIHHIEISGPDEVYESAKAQFHAIAYLVYGDGELDITSGGWSTTCSYGKINSKGVFTTPSSIPTVETCQVIKKYQDFTARKSIKIKNKPVDMTGIWEGTRKSSAGSGFIQLKIYQTSQTNIEGEYYFQGTPYGDISGEFYGSVENNNFDLTCWYWDMAISIQGVVSRKTCTMKGSYSSSELGDQGTFSLKKVVGECQ